MYYKHSRYDGHISLAIKIKKMGFKLGNKKNKGFGDSGFSLGQTRDILKKMSPTLYDGTLQENLTGGVKGGAGTPIGYYSPTAYKAGEGGNPPATKGYKEIVTRNDYGAALNSQGAYDPTRPMNQPSQFNVLLRDGTNLGWKDFEAMKDRDRNNLQVKKWTLHDGSLNEDFHNRPGIRTMRARYGSGANDKWVNAVRAAKKHGQSRQGRLDEQDYLLNEFGGGDRNFSGGSTKDDGSWSSGREAEWAFQGDYGDIGTGGKLTEEEDDDTTNIQ